MHSLSFDAVLEGEETLLAGLGLKNPCRFPENEPGILFTFLCKIQADVLAFFFHAQRPFDRSFLACWSVWMTPSEGPTFLFFENTLFREMMKSHSELGLVIRLFFP